MGRDDKPQAAPALLSLDRLRCDGSANNCAVATDHKGFALVFRRRTRPVADVCDNAHKERQLAVSVFDLERLRGVGASGCTD